MPMANVTGSQCSNVKFKWKSLGTAYTIFHVVYGSCITFLMMRFVYNQGINANNIGDFKGVLRIFLFILQYHNFGFSWGCIFFLLHFMWNYIFNPCLQLAGNNENLV